MRTTPWASLAVLVAFTIATGAQQPSTREARPASTVIEGRVISGSAPDARPVRHARVEIHGGGLTAPRVAETDAKGAFRFDVRAAGPFTLRIRKPGFVTFDGAPAATITLVRGAAIEGTVIDTSGEPLENARVTLLRAEGTRTTALDQSVLTDDLGRYRAHSLPAGDYLVQAVSAPSPPRLIGETAGGAASGFYPAAARAKDAQAVHVEAGVEARGVDITLDPAPPGPAPRPPAGARRAAGGARVSGRVVAADTGRPIKGAVVTMATAEGPRGGFQARTDADGRFAWTGVPAGRYAPAASAERFVTLTFGQSGPFDVVRPIDLKDGETFAFADIALLPKGAIEGRVLDAFGDPSPGVLVQAVRRLFVAGRDRLVPGGNSQPRTDDTGRFRLNDLAPGSYYLAALSGAFGSDRVSPGVPPAYFPGTADPIAAQSISLEMGASRTDIVIPLQPGPTFRVSGRVMDTAGQPAGRRGLLLLQTHGGDVVSLVGARGETSADGRFEFAGVPAGRYVLQSVAGSPLHEFASTELQVAEADVNDVELRISTGVTARGQITFEGDASLPATDKIDLFPQPVEFITSPAIGFGPPPLFVRPDWSFELRALSGLRVLTSRTLLGQWMLKGVTLNGVDVTDVPLDFRKGPIENLEVIFTSRITRVTASVVDDKGALVKDCTVLVFAADRARWTFPSRYITLGGATQDGIFRMRGLPPDDYLAVALPRVDGSEWQNPAFLDLLRPFATRFTLAEGESRSLELKLQNKL